MFREEAGQGENMDAEQRYARVNDNVPMDKYLDPVIPDKKLEDCTLCDEGDGNCTCVDTDKDAGDLCHGEKTCNGFTFYTKDKDDNGRHKIYLWTLKDVPTNTCMNCSAVDEMCAPKANVQWWFYKSLCKQV
jgi:hypothetical protein